MRGLKEAEIVFDLKIKSILFDSLNGCLSVLLSGIIYSSSLVCHHIFGVVGHSGAEIALAFQVGTGCRVRELSE